MSEHLFDHPEGFVPRWGPKPVSFAVTLDQHRALQQTYRQV